MEPAKHIDLTYLKGLSNGSNEFVNQMITIFMEQTPEMIANMEKHLADKNWQALRGTVHKMKPSISFIGIKELEGVVKEIEDTPDQEKDLDREASLIATIKTICNLAIRELEVEKKMFS